MLAHEHTSALRPCTAFAEAEAKLGEPCARMAHYHACTWLVKLLAVRLVSRVDLIAWRLFMKSSQLSWMIGAFSWCIDGKLGDSFPFLNTRIHNSFHFWKNFFPILPYILNLQMFFRFQKKNTTTQVFNYFSFPRVVQSYKPFFMSPLPTKIKINSRGGQICFRTAVQVLFPFFVFLAATFVLFLHYFWIFCSNMCYL